MYIESSRVRLQETWLRAAGEGHNSCMTVTPPTNFDRVQLRESSVAQTNRRNRPLARKYTRSSQYVAKDLFTVIPEKHVSGEKEHLN